MLDRITNAHDHQQYNGAVVATGFGMLVRAHQFLASSTVETNFGHNTEDVTDAAVTPSLHTSIQWLP